MNHLPSGHILKRWTLKSGRQYKARIMKPIWFKACEECKTEHEKLVRIESGGLYPWNYCFNCWGGKENELFKGEEK